MEVVDGVRVTSTFRTALDCARACRFPAALAIVDSALNITGASREELAHAFLAMGCRVPGADRARQVAQLADGCAQNGGESVARAAMIAHGFMRPELQVEVPDPVNPDTHFYVDFHWSLPSGDVAGELDGHDKYVDPVMTGGRDVLEVLTDERLRESRLSGANLKIMRFAYKDIFDSTKFCHLLTSYGIPRGFDVPPVARNWR